MTILITGGAGFIGSNFVNYILDNHKDHQIICVDALTYAGKMSNLSQAADNSNFRFVKADICDKETIFNVFKTYAPISSSTLPQKATLTAQ